MKRIVLLLLTLLYVSALTGCNTVEGMGKDLQRGGQELQDAAKDTKRDM